MYTREAEPDVTEFSHILRIAGPGEATLPQREQHNLAPPDGLMVGLQIHCCPVFRAARDTRYPDSWMKSPDF